MGYSQWGCSRTGLRDWTQHTAGGETAFRWQLCRGTSEVTWRKNEQGLRRERKLEKLQKSRCRIVQLWMILSANQCLLRLGCCSPSEWEDRIPVSTDDYISRGWLSGSWGRHSWVKEDATHLRDREKNLQFPKQMLQGKGPVRVSVGTNSKLFLNLLRQTLEKAEVIILRMWPWADRGVGSVCCLLVWGWEKSFLLWIAVLADVDWRQAEKRA